MSNTLMDRSEVRAFFKRNIACRSIEPSLLECIADAVGEVIEENNKRLLQELMHISKGVNV